MKSKIIDLIGPIPQKSYKNGDVVYSMKAIVVVVDWNGGGDMDTYKGMSLYSPILTPMFEISTKYMKTGIRGLFKGNIILYNDDDTELSDNNG